MISTCYLKGKGQTSSGLIFKISLVVCLGLVVIPSLRAGEVIQLDGFEHITSNYCAYYIDSTGCQTFDEITAIENNSGFREGVPEKLYNQFEDYAYWLYFKVKKDEDDWVFVLSDPYAGQVDFYNKTDDSLFHFQSGIERKFSLRTFAHTDHIFKFHFDDQETIDCYIRIKSIYRFSNNFLVTKENDIFRGSVKAYAIKGLLYGILILLVFYNATLFFLLRESVYLYYSFYLLTALVYIARDHFMGYQYVWPDYPDVNFYIVNFDKALLMIGFSSFSLVFLQLPLWKPRFYLVIFLNILFFVLLIVESILHVAVHLSDYLQPLVYVVIFAFAIQEFTQGKKYIRLYIIAFIGWFVGFFIFTSMGNDWFPSLKNSEWAPFAFNIGLIIETLIITIALIDRFRIMKENTIMLKNDNISVLEEKELLTEKINRELEGKVKERTQELYILNKELENKNEILEQQANEITNINILLDKDNYRLKKEMKRVTESKLFSQDFTYNEFLKVFPDDLSCFRHLAELKWTKGYTCKKCGSTQHSEGYRKFSKKCQKCGYDETVTAGTIFHQLRFPLNKAFYILFKTIRQGNTFSISEVAEEISLRKATCSSFRKKILDRKLTLNKSIKNEKLWKEIIFPND